MPAHHPTRLPLGINIDGVLTHDGLPSPSAAERFAWIAQSQAFDYVEKNIATGEDFAPYFDLVAQHQLPIRVFGGIFCAGRDEPTMRWGLRTAAELGARIFNVQLFARHASGQPITDAQVADFFEEMQQLGAPHGCQPSLEVHVDMWSERFQRVESVAELLARRGVGLRVTLDPSHLVFKVGLPQEQALSACSDEALLHPAGWAALWLREGWVAHAHARCAAPGQVAGNPWMQRAPGLPGRAIQYPLVAPQVPWAAPPWQAAATLLWQQHMQALLAAMQAQPERSPQQISCEFIPFADYGGGARYDIWAQNLACAAWLRQSWNDNNRNPA